MFWGWCDLPISRKGYVEKRSKSCLEKLCGRNRDLLKQYYVPFSQMLHDIMDDDHVQWHPPLIRHYNILRPCYRILHYNWIWFNSQIWEVFIERLQRVVHANRGPVPLWDLPVLQYWDKSLLNLSCFRDFEFQSTLLPSILPKLWKWLKYNSDHQLVE